MNEKNRFDRLCAGGFIAETEILSLNTEFDPIIVPDRKNSPAYPNWLRGLIHLELELAGPPSFDVSRPHKIYPAKGLTLRAFYEKLMNDNLLGKIVNLADILAIRARGPRFYKRHFAGEILFALSSAAQNRHGDLFVPSLIGCDVAVDLDWNWIDGDFSYPGVALRRESQILRLN